MDQKVSIKKLEQYAASFTESVLDSFFSKKDQISGKEILELTPIVQVNLLVIHSLMVKWQNETSRLKSPYFDYEHQEVKEAFGHFANLLSKHISVNRENLSPFLETATADTLSLILSPYDYYADALDTGGKGKVSVTELKNLVRYLRINKAPLEKLVSRASAGPSITTSLTGREAFGLLDAVLEEEGFSPEDPETHLRIFSKIKPVALPDLLEAPKVQNKPEPPPVLPPAKANTVKKVQPAPATQTSLYDELSKESRPTLADNFQKRKINSLKESLSINQKFMFTKLLFNGDFDLFGQAIERLDMMDNMQQVIRFIDMDYPEWDRTSEEFQEFISILERRFI
ncbi:MAG: hypothetical protein ACO3FI_04520 [Cyclobacteriaceae bacterium]